MLPDRHGGDLADRDFFEDFEPRWRRPPLRLGTICEQCWVQSGLVNTVGDFFCPHGGEQS